MAKLYRLISPAITSADPPSYIVLTFQDPIEVATLVDRTIGLVASLRLSPRCVINGSCFLAPAGTLEASSSCPLVVGCVRAWFRFVVSVSVIVDFYGPDDWSSANPQPGGPAV